MENPLQVLEALDTKKFIRGNAQPSPPDYLDAMINAEGMNRDAKKSIQKVLDVNPYVVQQKALIPSTTKGLIEKLQKELDSAKNFGETKNILPKFYKDKDFQNDGYLTAGMDMAWNIVDDRAHHPDRKNVFYSSINTIAIEGISGALYGAAGGAAASENQRERGVQQRRISGRRRGRCHNWHRTSNRGYPLEMVLLIIPKLQLVKTGQLQTLPP